MERLKRRLYRERRRVAIIAVLCLIAGYFSIDSGTGPFGFPLNLEFGFVLMITICALQLAVSLIFPDLRNTGEVIALMLVLESFYDSSRFGTSDVKSTAVVLIWLMVFYALSYLYSSSFLDRFLPKRSYLQTSTATSILTPDALWPYFAGTPDSPRSTWHEFIKDIQWVEQDRVYCMRVDLPNGQTVLETQTIQLSNYPTEFDVLIEITKQPSKMTIPDGASLTRFQDTATGSRLLRARIRKGVTIRDHIFWWIDDNYGRVDDMIIEHAEAQLTPKPSLHS